MIRVVREVVARLLWDLGELAVAWPGLAILWELYKHANP
jgi:hypothetical protein